MRRQGSIALLAAIAVSGGCATATIEEKIQHEENMRADFASQIQQVATHLKPEHFETCTRLIEGWVFEGTYRRTGAFHPAIQPTCAALRLDGAPRAAYFAPFVHVVAGKPDRPFAKGCVFSLYGTKIEVERGAPERTSRSTQHCAYLRT